MSQKQQEACPDGWKIGMLDGVCHYQNTDPTPNSFGIGCPPQHWLNPYTTYPQSTKDAAGLWACKCGVTSWPGITIPLTCDKLPTPSPSPSPSPSPPPSIPTCPLNAPLSSACICEIGSSIANCGTDHTVCVKTADGNRCQSLPHCPAFMDAQTIVPAGGCTCGNKDCVPGSGETLVCDWKNSTCPATTLPVCDTSSSAPIMSPGCICNQQVCPVAQGDPAQYCNGSYCTTTPNVECPQGISLPYKCSCGSSTCGGDGMSYCSTDNTCVTGTPPTAQMSSHVGGFKRCETQVCEIGTTGCYASLTDCNKDIDKMCRAFTAGGNDAGFRAMDVANPDGSESGWAGCFQVGSGWGTYLDSNGHIMSSGWTPGNPVVGWNQADASSSGWSACHLDIGMDIPTTGIDPNGIPAYMCQLSGYGPDGWLTITQNSAPCSDECSYGTQGCTCLAGHGAPEQPKRNRVLSYCDASDSHDNCNNNIAPALANPASQQCTIATQYCQAPMFTTDCSKLSCNANQGIQNSNLSTNPVLVANQQTKFKYLMDPGTSPPSPAPPFPPCNNPLDQAGNKNPPAPLPCTCGPTNNIQCDKGTGSGYCDWTPQRNCA